MTRRRKAAPANNAPREKSTRRDVRNASVAVQSLLEQIFDKATSSIVSVAQTDPAFEPYKDHLQVLTADYLRTPFDATPQNGIELKKKIFSVEGNIPTEEMKETIKEIRGDVEKLVDEMVKSAGHCCAIEKKHALHNLMCAGDKECRILPGEPYRILKDDNNEESTEFYCLKKVRGTTHYDRYVSRHSTAKFSETVGKTEHKPSDVEEWLECTECRTQHHPTCSMYHPAKDGPPFICPRCDPSKIRIFRAENLTKTKDTGFFENEFRKIAAYNHLKISCRVLYAARKAGNYFHKNKETRFPILGKLPLVPHTDKTYGFFVEKDGVDVLFFLLAIQEYKNVASRKNNTIYLDYLDSVKYVDQQDRAAVHKSVFQALCSYARNAGFRAIHFWASPPFKNEGYLFNARPGPPRERIPKQLCDWYRTAGKCESTKRVKQGFDLKGYDTVEDLLDAVCYEKSLFLDELEETLKDCEENKKLAKLRGNINYYKNEMFYVELKELDPEEVQPYPESLFLGRFASCDTFMENQRSRKFEFHRLDAAKFATQMIICAVNEERRISELQKLIGSTVEDAPPAPIPHPDPVAPPIPPAQPQVGNPNTIQMNAPPLLPAEILPRQPPPPPVAPPALPLAGSPNIDGMNAPPPQQAAVPPPQQAAVLPPQKAAIPPPPPAIPLARAPVPPQPRIYMFNMLPTNRYRVINPDGTPYRW